MFKNNPTKYNHIAISHPVKKYLRLTRAKELWNRKRLLKRITRTTKIQKQNDMI